MKFVIAALMIAISTHAFAIEKCDQKVIDASDALHDAREKHKDLLYPITKKLESAERKTERFAALVEITIAEIKFCAVYRSIYKQKESCLYPGNYTLDGITQDDHCTQVEHSFKKMIVDARKSSIR